ncbi:MAG: MFS transporter [Candidatus Margulisbacteria bacterium]|nr:MFS transporter [Candidatus Margulisiibacteriota bacterium]
MRNRIIDILLISLFVTMIGLGVVSPLLPLYAESFEATGLWLGIMFAAFSFSRMIFMPYFGKLSDKYGRKIFIAAGLLLYSMVSLFYAMANSLFALTLIRTIHGLASAMVMPIAMAYIGDISKKGKEGSMMGLTNSAIFLGLASGPFLGGFLMGSFGLPAVFLVISVLSGLTFLLTLFFLPEEKAEMTEDVVKKEMSYREMLYNSIVVGTLIFRLVNTMGRGILLSFLPLFAAFKLGLNAAQIGIIVSANIFLTAILQGALGGLSDRFNKADLIVGGSSVCALSLVLMGLATDFWQLLMLSSVMGIASAIAIPAATAFMVVVGKKTVMGEAMGLFSTSMSAGMVLAPIIAGFTDDHFGIGAVFGVAGVLVLMGTLIFYYFIQKGLRVKILAID